MTESREYESIRILEQYVNGRAQGRLTRLAAVFVPSISFFAEASRVRRSKLRPVPYASLPPSSEGSFLIEGYEAKNGHLRALRDYLRKSCSGDLVGALVHGSLATGEEIAYSDCDVLAILRKEVFASEASLRRAARKLYVAKKFMNRYDPLQHHGWFVLSEDDLLSCPEHYLPLAVLRRSQALFPVEGLEIRLRPIVEPLRFRESFESLRAGIARRLKEVPPARNLYELKGLLSQFMLLPSLYVQVRDGRGVFKKDSFAAARRDFSVDQWSIMDVVSAIREEWTFQVAGFRRWMLTRNSPWRDWLAPRIAPGIPTALADRLTPEFFMRMRELAESMLAKLP